MKWRNVGRLTSPSTSLCRAGRIGRRFAPSQRRLRVSTQSVEFMRQFMTVLMQEGPCPQPWSMAKNWVNVGISPRTNTPVTVAAGEPQDRCPSPTARLRPHRCFIGFTAAGWCVAPRSATLANLVSSCATMCTTSPSRWILPFTPIIPEPNLSVCYACGDAYRFARWATSMRRSDSGAPLRNPKLS